jgi:hypothetical protein
MLNINVTYHQGDTDRWHDTRQACQRSRLRAFWPPQAMKKNAQGKQSSQTLETSHMVDKTV